MHSVSDAAAFLRQHAHFTLISHVSPDGDTLGSTIALAKGLMRLGKTVQLVCCEPVPAVYSFLNGADMVILPEHAAITEACITVDCADIRRTGAAAPLFEGAKYTLVIDHHMTNPLFGQVNVVEDVAATGEIVYRLLCELGVSVDAEIAELLYTAIAADTGNFAFSNVTEQSFMIAGRLRATGFDLPGTNRKLFRTYPFRRIRLRGRVLSKARLFLDGKIAISTITHGDFADCGASAEDAEGFIDDLRDIDSVEVAAILRESPDDSIRVSLRGKSYGDVSRIATHFHGGGHRLAAGCTLYCGIDEAADAVRAAAEKLLTEGDC